MRVIMFIGIALLLGLAGCAGDQYPTAIPGSDLATTPGTLTVGAENAFGGGPLRGTIKCLVVTTGDCGAYTLKTSVEGDGKLTLLGWSEFTGELCAVWADNIPPFEGGMTGVGTAIAANGDEIYISLVATYYAAEPPPTTLEVTGTYTITGGTGRFLGASGSGSLYGEEELNDLLGNHDAWFKFDGMLEF